jgi:hypothetical protein
MRGQNLDTVLALEALEEPNSLIEPIAQDQEPAVQKDFESMSAIEKLEALAALDLPPAKPEEI